MGGFRFHFGILKRRRAMSRIFSGLFAIFLCLSALPAHAHHHGGFFSFGFCCGPYFAPYYGSSIYGFGAGAYEAPSTIVYTGLVPLPPITTVLPPVILSQPASQPLPATSASEPFQDSRGRTCRTFKATVNGSPLSGTACLQPDGSWRTVGN